MEAQKCKGELNWKPGMLLMYSIARLVVTSVPTMMRDAVNIEVSQPQGQAYAHRLFSMHVGERSCFSLDMLPAQLTDAASGARNAFSPQ